MTIKQPDWEANDRADSVGGLRLNAHAGAVVFTLKGATVATEYFEGKISTGYRQVVDDLPEFDAHSAVLGNGTQFEYSVSV